MAAHCLIAILVVKKVPSVGLKASYVAQKSVNRVIVFIGEYRHYD